MTTTKALEILKHHNIWRRGLVDDSKYTPTEIGEAIDAAIRHFEHVENLIEIEAERLFGTDNKPKQ